MICFIVFDKKGENMEVPDCFAWILLILAIIGGIYGVAYAGTWIGCQPNAGQKYDVIVTVQAVERSTRFGDHTNLWVRVYGQQDITYKLIGFHNFTIGKTYRLVFVDEPYLCSYVIFWFETRGKVLTIEEVTNSTNP